MKEAWSLSLSVCPCEGGLSSLTLLLVLVKEAWLMSLSISPYVGDMTPVCVLSVPGK